MGQFMILKYKRTTLIQILGKYATYSISIKVDESTVITSFSFVVDLFRAWYFSISCGILLTYVLLVLKSKDLSMYFVIDVFVIAQ